MTVCAIKRVHQLNSLPLSVSIDIPKKAGMYQKFPFIVFLNPAPRTLTCDPKHFFHKKILNREQQVYNWLWFWFWFFPTKSSLFTFIPRFFALQINGFQDMLREFQMKNKNIYHHTRHLPLSTPWETSRVYQRRRSGLLMGCYGGGFMGKGAHFAVRLILAFGYPPFF